jgi:N-acetylneuraminate synthase/N,N'-diacetyllegionaminate synthase
MNRPIFIIAEAGVNHNGDLRMAKRLVDAAKGCGADAVKFQSFKAERIASRHAALAEYQKRSVRGDSQLEMIRRLELDEEAHRVLFSYCRKERIQFLSTPFDEGSADLLERLGVKAFKLPSGEITNKGLLEHVARKRKPLYLSTGMSTLAEVRAAVGWIRAAGGPSLTLLHCVTEYPAPAREINLRAMKTLSDAFGLPVGYSDHTMGIEVPTAAAALGATVIEKHFTLDRLLPGPDHKASLEPPEFAAMVRAIRSVEAALGDGIKRPAPCERKNIAIARKSLVAAADLERGHVLRPEDLLAKRPGTGISPADLGRILGRTLRMALRADGVLAWKHLRRS